MSTPAVRSTSTVSDTDLQAEIDRLTKSNEALKAQPKPENSFRLQVSEKGAVSVYGMGRFPVSLYKSQWELLLSHASEIIQFCNANETAMLKNQIKAKAEAIEEKAQVEAFKASLKARKKTK